MCDSNDFQYRDRGFNGHEKFLLKEVGYTPESARDYVVGKLIMYNISSEDLKYFLVPVDELSYIEREAILNLTLYYRDEPKLWVERIGKDLSCRKNFSMMLNFGKEMMTFDKTWFSSAEEKIKASEDARKILESAGMHQKGIENFLKNDELIWSVCRDSEFVLNWNKSEYVHALDTDYGYVDLANVLLEIS